MDSNNPVPQASAPNMFEGPGALLKFGWMIFTKHWKAVGLVILVPSVITGIASLLIAIKNPGVIILAIIVGILGVVFQIASIPAAVQAIHRVATDPSTPVSLKSQYRFGFSLFWSFILVSIINGLVSFGSMALFIIPGIVVSVYGSVYLYTFVIDGKKGFSALTESYALVRGRWWGVVGRAICLGLVSAAIWLVILGLDFLLALIFGVSLRDTAPSFGTTLVQLVGSLIGTAIIGPIAGGYMYRMYVSLKTSKPAGDVKTSTFKGWLIAFVVIGVLAVIGFIIAIPAFVLLSARSEILKKQGALQSNINTIQSQIDAANLKAMQAGQNIPPQQ